MICKEATDLDYIDLRSDTVTRPTEKMRRAMAAAEVGDDVYGEDPTINRLQELAAEILGKEAALFVPSGTMGNQACLMAHTQRGDEVLLEEQAHIFLYEAGGAALLSQCQTRTIPGENGILDPDQVRDAIRGENIHFPRSSLLCLENTHNRAGGTVTPPELMRELAGVAHSAGLKVHLDGARVFNAACAAGVPVSEMVDPVDSVQFCLSKGLAAPVGSIVAGSRAFIDRCLGTRKILGGGMRQAGILAAAGIIALEEMVERLAEDHENARQLAEAIAEMDPFIVDLDTVQTNIVAFDVDPEWFTAADFLAEMGKRGVRANPVSPQRIRLVTHYEVSRANIETTLEAMNEVISSW